MRHIFRLCSILIFLAFLASNLYTELKLENQENSLFSKYYSYHLQFNRIYKYADRLVQSVKLNNTEAVLPPPADGKPVILMWSKYYNNSEKSVWNGIHSGGKIDSDCCSETSVEITFDRKMLPRATAIVFYSYSENLKPNDLPPRDPKQVWILFSKESPAHSANLTAYNNLFNWTMTYRRDSDIWSPYGYTEKLPAPLEATQPILMPGSIPLENWIAEKSKMLAAVISHCRTKSKREDVLKSLQKYLPSVDTYGMCGANRMCLRKSQNCNKTKFWKDLSKDYKFYFAAENSLCEDYITEKFWRPLEQGMVPLVYGGGDYAAVAPPNSFIDVRQFKTIKELAEYLKRISDSKEKYAKYFEWRRSHKVVLTDAWHGWCSLCRKVREYKRNPDAVPRKVYDNLSYWWIGSQGGSGAPACVPLNTIDKNGAVIPGDILNNFIS